MKTIRILQLSDIHWKKQRDAADDYTDIRDKMLQDLNYYCQETGNSFALLSRLEIIGPEKARI